MNSKQIVLEIKRRKKHEDHTGGLDGCPLCSRATTMIDTLAQDDAPVEETAPVQAPAQSRLDKIFNK